MVPLPLRGDLDAPFRDSLRAVKRLFTDECLEVPACGDAVFGTVDRVRCRSDFGACCRNSVARGPGRDAYAIPRSVIRARTSCFVKRPLA